jgi:hypothetical protein
MTGILDKNIYIMAHCVSMAKHDSLDKAPLNDEVISREQKFYVGNITSCKVSILSCPWAQVISNWKQACHAIQLLWVTVYCTPVKSNFFFILKCNKHTSYTMMKDTSPGTTQSRSSSAGKRTPILRGINIHIFSYIVKNALEWLWVQLKHPVSYKIPCAENDKGMRGGHQSPAYKPSHPFNFSTRMM